MLLCFCIVKQGALVHGLHQLCVNEEGRVLDGAKLGGSQCRVAHMQLDSFRHG